MSLKKVLSSTVLICLFSCSGCLAQERASVSELMPMSYPDSVAQIASIASNVSTQSASTIASVQYYLEENATHDQEEKTQLIQSIDDLIETAKTNETYLNSFRPADALCDEVEDLASSLKEYRTILQLMQKAVQSDDKDLLRSGYKDLQRQLSLIQKYGTIQ